ncbi:lactosylceramide 4-alpha-galactosyltransferase-like [Hemiscyllium ocellatum]|uniref:lactosylceramide 4-alpha-galactosyltransferase-like n=1 Tax=Hemiscyllium ocellatum TaxID=170820 RepID=UPI0029674FA6|nr:lactosylceramide 4-alpha-galactosyltransferase-like [Hemiscyllium ocellatum]
MKGIAKFAVFFLMLVFALAAYLLLIPSLNETILKLSELPNTLANYMGNPVGTDQIKLPTSSYTVCVKCPHPSTDPGIMFLQTSSQLNPSSLAMCGIESAARLNPNKPVYYFMKAFNGNISAYRDPEYNGIRLLSSFKNVIILPLNPKELFNNTPLAGWYEKVDPSKERYWFHVLADGCRLALLWKYGGIYLDTDIISLKPLEFQNFIGAESVRFANNAALGFNRSHSYVESCLRDFVEKFNGAAWGHQGPRLMTRMVKKWCGTDNLQSLFNKGCKGIMFLSDNWFYPIPFSDWKKYFEKNQWNNNSDDIEKKFSQTKGVHVWSYASSRQKIQIRGSHSLVEYFFSTYCPSTYETLPK